MLRNPGNHDTEKVIYYEASYLNDNNIEEREKIKVLELKSNDLKLNRVIYNGATHSHIDTDIIVDISTSIE